MLAVLRIVCDNLCPSARVLGLLLQEQWLSEVNLVKILFHRVKQIYQNHRLKIKLYTKTIDEIFNKPLNNYILALHFEVQESRLKICYVLVQTPWIHTSSFYDFSESNESKLKPTINKILSNSACIQYTLVYILFSVPYSFFSSPMMLFILFLLRLSCAYICLVSNITIAFYMRVFCRASHVYIHSLPCLVLTY